MGTIEPASILLFLAAAATIVVAFIVIYSRKKRQAQSTTRKIRPEMEEAQRKIEDESPRGPEGLQNAKNGQKRLDGGVSPDSKEEDRRREVEQEAIRRAEEDERQRLEAKRRQIEEELRKAQEELHKADEERKRLDEEARRMMEESRRKAEVQRQTEELRKAEEEHRRAQEQQKCREADETQRRAEEEIRRKTDELQELEEDRRRSEEGRKCLEEETRRKGEEAQRKAENETRHEAEKEARQRAKEDRERRHIPLDQRPPRRQPGLQEPSEKPRPRETKQHRPKPEVICWKRERQWILEVEVPEELLGSSGLVVLQNASLLTQDEYREGCWRLEQAFGEVMVRWNKDEDVRESNISLSKENYLLFKLTGQNQSQGRRVKSPSSGSHLVVVPETWDRDEALSGSPPVTPAFVSISEYRAHFFILEKDDSGKIAFRIPDDMLVVIEPKASRFELTGNRLDDATEDRGPLFGQKPPQIHALDEQAWKDVETIVVGEEGSGKGRWRAAFSPVQGLIEQDLPSEVVARKGGWYFLRFYDADDDLVESLDFRFVGGLKDIKVHQPSPLPSEAGHVTVSVELFHEPDCCIQPACGLEGNVQIEHEDDKTILTIPPDPTSDETRWLVGPQDGPQVEVTILVERLWWDVGEEDNAPSEWEDQLLILSRNDFTATSKKALWLLLPRRRWVDRVLVGFEQPRARTFTAKVMERMITIPLRDFGDSQEVEDCTQEHLLKVWIKCDDGVGEAVIAIIAAEPPVIVRQGSTISRLNLYKIPAPGLASVLAGLRRVTHGPLRGLIKEVRYGYPRRRAAHPAESEEFIKKALCVIALSLDLGAEKQSQILGLKNRWTARAHLAKDEFPEVISQLRNRYEKLKTRRARQASRIREKRKAE